MKPVQILACVEEEDMSLTPEWAVTDIWLMLGMGESVFYKGKIQWMDT